MMIQNHHNFIGGQMPYTEKQHRLFEAAAHNPKVAKSHGLSQTDAKRMASEGVKKKKMPWHAVFKRK
jgi:hypothetical protein